MTRKTTLVSSKNKQLSQEITQEKLKCILLSDLNCMTFWGKKKKRKTKETVKRSVVARSWACWDESAEHREFLEQ